MRKLVLWLLALCALPMLAGVNPALASQHAFVVGIDRYDNLPSFRQLRNAASDAAAIGTALEALGYKVTVTENTDRISLVRQWQQFLSNIKQGDSVVFFFAGHGVEIGGLNYLLPRDVPSPRLGEEEVLKAGSLSLGDFLEQLSDRKPQTALYIVDACRDNPFVDNRGRSIGTSRGLARVDPPSGTFVMFSAAARQTALDRLSDSDPDPNSVFTRTLLTHIVRPGADLPEIARAVRNDVMNLALSARPRPHDQRPAYYDEMVGRFCPAGCDAPGAAVPMPKPDPVAQAWAATQNTTSIPVLEDFIRRFGESSYAALARARIAEIEKTQQFAALPPQASMASPAGDTLAPDAIKRALPNNIRIDPEVLRLVQTDPFFANAPPVRVSSYQIKYQDRRGNTNQHEVKVRPLNSTLSIHEESTDSSLTGYGPRVLRTKGRDTVLKSGTVSLGISSGGQVPTYNNKLTTLNQQWSTTKLDRLEGTLFPMAVAKKYRYRTATRYGEPSGDGDNLDDATCEVEKELPAAAFHRNLNGKAFVVGCEVKWSYSRSQRNGMKREVYVFVNELGVFLQIDALDKAQLHLSDSATTQLVGFTLRN
jgi:uncharacterized caspase-like protein